MSLSDRKIAYLMEHVRRLCAGVRALQTVALKYGQHTDECATREPGWAGTTPLDPCSCDWDSTRQVIEAPAAEPEKTLVTS